MSGVLLKGLIGNERLLKALCFCLKQVLGSNRPFVCVVIEQDANASVHSNMDVPSERISLLDQTVASLKTGGNVIVKPNGRH